MYRLHAKNETVRAIFSAFLTETDSAEMRAASRRRSFTIYKCMNVINACAQSATEALGRSGHLVCVRVCACLCMCVCQFSQCRTGTDTSVTL